MEKINTKSEECHPKVKRLKIIRVIIPKLSDTSCKDEKNVKIKNNSFKKSSKMEKKSEEYPTTDHFNKITKIIKDPKYNNQLNLKNMPQFEEKAFVKNKCSDLKTNERKLFLYKKECEDNLPRSMEELIEANNYKEIINKMKKQLSGLKNDNSLTKEIEQITQKIMYTAAFMTNIGKLEEFRNEVLELSTILNNYIEAGKSIAYSPNCNFENFQTISIAANASLTVLYLYMASNVTELTTSNFKSVLKNIADFTKNQISLTLKPEFKNVISNNMQLENQKRKSVNNRKTNNTTINENISVIYQKLSETMNLLSKLSELLDSYEITSLLEASFSVFQTKHMNALQIFCLKFVTEVASSHSEDQDLLYLILSELVSNDSVLIQGDYYTLDQTRIELYTALVLKVIQCLCFHRETSEDQVLKMVAAKQMQMSTFCASFLKNFLNTCQIKKSDFKFLLKNFLNDLIVLIDKPEWPVVIYVIKKLGELLDRDEVEEDVQSICIEFCGQIIVKIKNIFVNSSQDERLKEAIKYGEIVQTSAENIEIDEYVILQMQKYILDFYENNSLMSEESDHAYLFIVTLWLKDAFTNHISELQSPTTEPKKSKKSKTTSVSVDKHLETVAHMFRWIISFIKNKTRRIYLKEPKDTVEYDAARLLMHCVSLPSLTQSINCYSSVIRKNIQSDSKNIVNKSLRAITIIIENYQNTFTLAEVISITNKYIFDSSAKVKESAINLLGKYLKRDSNALVEHTRFFCEMLRSKELNVKKRTIDILAEIHEYCTNNELYLKLSEFHDDEKISKAILEIFEKKWFFSEGAPMDVMVDMIKNANDTQIKHMRSILIKLFECKSNTEKLNNFIKILSRDLVNKIFKTNMIYTDSALPFLVTFHMLAKANSQSASVHCESVYNINFGRLSDCEPKLLKYVVKIIKLLIPVTEETPLLNQLELKLVRAVGFLNRSIIKTAISCLSILAANTKNYTLTGSCFKVYYNVVKSINTGCEITQIENIKRALLISGLFALHFDFNEEEIVKHFVTTEENIIDSLFESLLKAYSQKIEKLKSNIVESLGLICVKYDDYLMNRQFQEICFQILKNDDDTVEKFEILKMFKAYLQRQMKIYDKLSNMSRREKQQMENYDIKSIDDDSLGRPSIVTQTFLKFILRSVISEDANIRQITIEIIHQINIQGLVNPVQILPFLICMTIDENKVVSETAEEQLQQVKIKFPNFLNSECLPGIRLSFKLRKMEKKFEITRGTFYSQKFNVLVAVNEFLYKLLQKSKQQRRALIMGILREFDEKEDLDNLEYLLFLADNLSAFPYETYDEIYFTLYNITHLLIHYGASTLRNIKKTLTDNIEQNRRPLKVKSENIPENIFNNKNALLQLLPDTKILTKYIHKFSVYNLLLELRDYFLKRYEIKESDLRDYLPHIPIKFKDNFLHQSPYKRFNPEKVLKACVEERSKEHIISNKGLKKKKFIQTEEDLNRDNFVEEFFVFQEIVKRDEGDEEEIITSKGD